MSSPRRILVADDNRDSADSLAIYLELNGYKTFVAYRGEEALQLAAQCRPEICILDIGMPDLSGYAVAERIRREAWGRGAVCAVALRVAKRMTIQARRRSMRRD